MFASFFSLSVTWYKQVLNGVYLLTITFAFCAGYWEEEHSYSRRSWQRYQREVMHELGCRGDDDNGDDDDDDGDKYDSD